ncbi:iron-sulfur cluster biosynthesis family protein [Enterococcus sp. 669A]|uniref:Iron-sulfur cluster biosynthesis family protein n=1 Tax=Candidatus Enterococcus moelleringii TaxID=2815325 RepID=A0ABS3LDM8_9ENTE|nr:iron-sulfur cluster biosynthesis family protein [Enterococcus sp. 669A]MBO1307732.1 iron-sulfur cluster biosynthesis family protein [Enterococcus sp. 669A]
MYLEISEELKEKFEDYVKDSVVVLDLDDGVGKYTRVGFCSLNISFRFLVLREDQDRSDYQTPIESTVGEILVKDHSMMHLDDKMQLVFDKQRGLTKLKGTSGLIDGNIQIIDLREQK